MNKDKIEGKGKEAMGSAREKAGHTMGNDEMEAKGAAQKTEGKVQGTAGKVKDKVGDMKDKVTRR